MIGWIRAAVRDPHQKYGPAFSQLSLSNLCLGVAMMLKKNHDQRLTQTPAEIPIVQGNMVQGTRWAPLIDGMTLRIPFLFRVR